MFVCGCELREGEELRGAPCAVLSVNPQFFPFLVLGCFEGLRVLGGTDKTDVVYGLYSLKIKLTDGNRALEQRAVLTLTGGALGTPAVSLRGF